MEATLTASLAPAESSHPATTPLRLVYLASLDDLTITPALCHLVLYLSIPSARLLTSIEVDRKKGLTVRDVFEGWVKLLQKVPRRRWRPGAGCSSIQALACSGRWIRAPSRMGGSCR